MDVGVVVLVVVHERVDDLARLLRGRGVVQVHERLAVHLALEDGEVFADGFDVKHELGSSAVVSSTSTLTSSPSDLDGIGVHGLHGGQGLDGAGLHVEAGAVARALDGAVPERALAERAVVVGTEVVDGVEACRRRWPARCCARRPGRRARCPAATSALRRDAFDSAISSPSRSWRASACVERARGRRRRPAGGR